MSLKLLHNTSRTNEEAFRIPFLANDAEDFISSTTVLVAVASWEPFWIMRAEARIIISYHIILMKLILIRISKKEIKSQNDNFR
jgi:hypothetical protein